MTKPTGVKRSVDWTSSLASAHASTKRPKCHRPRPWMHSSGPPSHSLSLSEIWTLNKLGTTSFQEDKMEDAKTHFTDALRRTLVVAQTNSTTEKQSKRSVETADNLEKQTDANCETVLIKRTSNYDEGMYVFHGPRDLDSLEMGDCSTVIAVLCYNLGQIDACLGKYVGASNWFQMALNHLNDDVGILKIQVWHCLGYCAYSRGSYVEAGRFFMMAMNGLRQSSLNDELCEAATNNCIGVLLLYSSANKKEGTTSQLLNLALEHLQDSLHAYRKYLDNEKRQKQLRPSNRSVTNTSERIATVFNNLGRVCFLRGKTGDAIAAYKEALQIRRSLAFGTVSHDLFATLCNIGQCYQVQKDFNDAMEYYQEAWAIIQHECCSTQLCLQGCRYNPSDAISTTKSIADIHDMRGEIDEAITMYCVSVRLSRRIGDPRKCPRLAALLNKVGTVYFAAGRTEEAMRCFEESLEIEETVFGLCHPRPIVTMTNIAHVYRQRHEYEKAYIQYDHVRVLQIEVFGRNHIDVAQTLLHMGLMKYHLTMYNTAFQTYQDALRIQRAHFGSDDRIEIASTLNSIGLVLVHLQERQQSGTSDCWNKRLAKVMFMESLRIRTNLLGRDHTDIAISCYNLATVCMGLGDDELAIKLYRETLRIEKLLSEKSRAKDNCSSDIHTPHCDNDIIVTLEQLGIVHQQRGDIDEALECFSEALELERSKPVRIESTTSPATGEDHFQNQLVVAKLLNLIGNLQLQKADVHHMMVSFAEASRLFMAYNRSQIGHPQDMSATLTIAGYNFYALSRLNPSCAAVA